MAEHQDISRNLNKTNLFFLLLAPKKIFYCIFINLLGVFFSNVITTNKNNN